MHLLKSVRVWIISFILALLCYVLLLLLNQPKLRLDLCMDGAEDTVKVFYSARAWDFSGDRSDTNVYTQDNSQLFFKFKGNNINNLYVLFLNDDTEMHAEIKTIAYYDKFPFVKYELHGKEINECIGAQDDNITDLYVEDNTLHCTLSGKSASFYLGNFKKLSYISLNWVEFLGMLGLLFLCMVASMFIVRLDKVDKLIRIIKKNKIVTQILSSLEEAKGQLQLKIGNKIVLFFDYAGNLNKKQAVIGSGIIYATVTVWYAIKYRGWFSFDEFYHISTLNPHYVTGYHRANYINWAEKVVCAIFGQSDTVVKLVPIMCGLISFVCCMYLAYNLYNNSLWIVSVGCVISFCPYILYNHNYIRMYVFLEMFFMLASVMFYRAVKNTGIIKLLYVLCADCICLFYILNTDDFTSLALAVIAVVAALYCLFEKLLWKLINDYPKRAYGVIAFVIVVGIVVALAIKKQWIDYSMISLLGVKEESYNEFMELLQEFFHANTPVLLKFIYVKNFFIIIPFIIAFVYVFVWKKSSESVLFIVGLCPVIGCSVLLYDTAIIRAFIAFWPIICVLAFIWLDTVKINKKIHLMVICVLVACSININTSFWSMPRIPGESSNSNLGGAYYYAEKYEKLGYEIVTLMTCNTQSAYFNLLDVEINLQKYDLIDAHIDPAVADEMLLKILNGTERYVVIMDDSISMYNKVCGSENYSNVKIYNYGGYAYLMLIN